jgi:hypothetical protein
LKAWLPDRSTTGWIAAVLRTAAAIMPRPGTFFRRAPRRRAERRARPRWTGIIAHGTPAPVVALPPPGQGVEATWREHLVPTRIPAPWDGSPGSPAVR